MIPTIPDSYSLQMVLPEILLVATMCAIIIVPFFKRNSFTLPAGAAMTGLIAAFAALMYNMNTSGAPLFHGALSVDPMSQFIKAIIIGFTLLVTIQWLLGNRAEAGAADAPDFLCLVVGAALGMCLMSSASSLLTIFIATEAASYPSYALAGFRKRHRVGSEGSLKYVIFGSAASAIMAYGMSLIYGVTGSLALSDVAAVALQPAGLSPLLAIGLAMMLAGVAFKLSAVPFHFWCPDVFQGAPIEVTTFLSVASKAGAVALLMRILATFASDPTLAGNTHLMSGLSVGVGVMGAVTATWGNLVALHQTNIKRLLAYSSIAHAGYMIMAASVLPLIPTNLPNPVASSILFYLFVYLFMNMGAFTVAMLLSQQAGGSENIRDFAGLGWRSPVLASLFSIFLLSLFGMPGLGGFAGKVYLAIAMTEVGPAGFVLIAVLLINTLLSLFYYVTPLRYMFLVKPPEDRPVVYPSFALFAILLLCAAALVWTGILPDKANRMASDFATIRAQATVSVAQATDGAAAPR